MAAGKKNLCLGLLAHVDAGKTTLSEALLYASGAPYDTLEDVIGVLIDKSVIRFTDLPKQAQRKLSERHFMRDHINSVGLLDESGDDDGIV